MNSGLSSTVHELIHSRARRGAGAQGTLTPSRTFASHPSRDLLILQYLIFKGNEGHKSSYAGLKPLAIRLLILLTAILRIAGRNVFSFFFFLPFWKWLRLRQYLKYCQIQYSYWLLHIQKTIAPSNYFFMPVASQGADPFCSGCCTAKGKQLAAMKYCPARQKVEGHLRFAHGAVGVADANPAMSSITAPCFPLHFFMCL